MKDPSESEESETILPGDAAGLPSELPTSEGPSLHARHIVADRYEIVSQLGRGGMGEVWHAYDLKLRVDVALKSLRLDVHKSQDGVEALRGEVRTAREVISPNVCRIFDLVVEQDRELISMEYIDGKTLLSVLIHKGPMELRQARDIAAQFLAGLEAIHRAGLVHRDLKPENIMITRTGRVVVMDFGIAKQVAQVGGTISGTLPYMSPEQLSGEKVDARSDVYSAGVVLAEMIHAEGILTQKTREGIWNAVRQHPMQLPESPWKAVITRAVSTAPEDRYSSAGALSRALEEVTQRVETIEERRPYPGLSSFAASDAEYFFGRELEVETVIKKLQQLHLMALIGPSGAGKTSFLQAGLIPALSQGWRCILCQPGDSPFVNLAQALVPEIAQNLTAMRNIVRFEEHNTALSVLKGWRESHSQCVLMIDRFEELFTLNRPEMQSRFTELIGKVVLETDIRVLLAMRDDFLFLCANQASLSPIFSELTPLTPLSGASLRRALVQPALKAGYRFEEDALVDEIISHVEKERGALPLMAFTAARLWEKRDRTSGLLTRQAYHEIGGIAGALAQHAESTMDRIGAERQPIVREVFRNLITAQNTRAARDMEELLSVFPDESVAREVLGILIDARLLTTFEAPQQEGETPKSRVEIIHESLLSNWPRLVRWQTQDADGAQLRDQLRQAAQMWEQRRRSQDLLWTGTAYLEFQAWRQNYHGGLTATEEAFVQAMKNRATKQRRQRRIAVSAVFAVLVAILAVVSGFWRGEKLAREQAVEEAHRAEASKILALARNELEKDPTVALAYAVASLQVSDSKAGRLFALEALSRGPSVSVESNVPIRPTFLSFSPNSDWLAIGGYGGVRLLRKDGNESRVLEEGFSEVLRSRWPQFSPDGDSLVWVSARDPALVRIWSVPEQKEVQHYEAEGRTINVVRGDTIFLITDASGLPHRWKETVVRAWKFKDSEPKILGRIDFRTFSGRADLDIDPTGQWMVCIVGNSIYLRSLANLAAPPRLIGELTAVPQFVTFVPDGKAVATADASGEIRFWSVFQPAVIPQRIFPAKGQVFGLYFNHSGSVLAVSYGDGRVLLWDLRAPEENEPLTLQRNVVPFFPMVAFTPDDRWIAAAYSDSLAFWPLPEAMPRVLRTEGDEGMSIDAVDFLPDGKSLAAGFATGNLYLWSWPNGQGRILWKPSKSVELIDMKVHPSGQFVGAGTSHDGAFLISIPDGKAIQLPGIAPGRSGAPILFSPDGKLIATAAFWKGEDSGIRIWDLASFDLRVLKESQGMVFEAIEFAQDGTLYSGDSQGNLRRWDVGKESSRVVFNVPGLLLHIAFARNNPDVMVGIWGSSNRVDRQQFRSEVRIVNLRKKQSYTVPTHGNRATIAEFDPSGKLLITGDMDGVLRIGPVAGDEPHVFFGHHSGVGGLAVHPTGRWIASAEISEPVIRIWQMPQGTPLQVLSHEDLLKYLRSLTNIKVVADPATATGYSARFDKFQGWGRH